MSVFAFLSAFVIWISLGVHLVVVEIMHDMCAESDRMEQQQGTGNATLSPLGYLIKCSDNNTNMISLFANVRLSLSFVIFHQLLTYLSRFNKAKNIS